MIFVPKWIVMLLFINCVIFCVNRQVQKPKPKKINKDVRDYTDADLEHLLDQWEVRF